MIESKLPDGNVHSLDKRLDESPKQPRSGNDHLIGRTRSVFRDISSMVNRSNALRHTIR